MFSITFTNFGHSANGSWTTIEAAISAAKGFGFDATILHGKAVAGFWSILGGYRPYTVEPAAWRRTGPF